MTRKELVDALTANFAEDEVITFAYIDGDYVKTTDTDVAIQNFTEFYHKGHWEYLDNVTGEWIPTTVEELQKDAEKQKRVTSGNNIRTRRWVPEGRLSVKTKKVLYIRP